MAVLLLLACLLASRPGAKKIIALTGKSEYIGILPSIERSGCWFNATQIAANAIFRLMAADIMRVDSVLQKFKYVGKSIKECDFPEGLLLALIVREDYVFSPNGSTILKPGDTLIVIADMAIIHKVKAYL